MSKEGCSFHYYLKVFEGFLFERIFPLLSTILTSKTETVSPSLRISVSIQRVSEKTGPHVLEIQSTLFIADSVVV